MNLADPKILKPFLQRHGLDAKKRLGQHFLVSSSVVEAIVVTMEGTAGALEIGPGPGVLTGAVSAAVEKMIALEIDERLAPALGESAPGVEIIFGDALTFDLGSLLERLPEPRAVVSNLPYYITGPLLGRIVDVRDRWSKAVLMMQREVGNRILAKPGDRERGGLSVMIEARFSVRKIANVPPGAFMPPPKVDSVVLELTPKPCDLPEAFFQFAHRGFAQPRKTLANNLAAVGFDRILVVEAGLPEKVRPHELDLEQWSRLFALAG